MHSLLRTAVLAAVAISSIARAELPSVDSFPDAHRAAPEDAAVVVGIDQYAFVDKVPFAERDAQAFWSFLVFDHGVSPDRISLLKDASGANDRIAEEVEKRAAQVGPGGTLWFYFAGHGAPDPEGKDGLLVGVDAQQTVKSVVDRSVSRRWLLEKLTASKAKHVVVFLDACFSGKSKGGGVLAAGLRPLIPTAAVGNLTRGILVTAAKSNQMSGPLDDAQHGLFTYFLLGALRGWELPGGKGAVTMRGAFDFVRKGMGVVLASGDRDQEPELTVTKEAADLVLAEGLGETGPDLARIAVAITQGRPTGSPAPAAVCPSGQSVTDDTAGHCCWPAQSWSKSRSKCLGTPECPPPRVASGEDCQVTVVCPANSSWDGSKCVAAAPAASPAGGSFGSHGTPVDNEPQNTFAEYAFNVVGGSGVEVTAYLHEALREKVAVVIDFQELKIPSTSGPERGRVSITAANNLTADYALLGISFTVDGIELYNRVDRTGGFATMKTLPVFEGALPPGVHHVGARFLYRTQPAAAPARSHHFR